MDSFKRAWFRIPKAVRKPLVFMIGTAVIATGVLMLIFPGPGWAAIFLGFAILATEFAFAEKVRDWLIAQVKRWSYTAKQYWKRIRSRQDQHRR